MVFNPFLTTNVPFLYPLKTSESIRFSDVFKGYRSEAMVENGSIKWRPFYSCHERDWYRKIVFSVFAGASQANGFGVEVVSQGIQSRELTRPFENIYDESNYVKQDQNSNNYEEVQSANNISLECDLNNSPAICIGNEGYEFPAASKDETDNQPKNSRLYAKINKFKPEQQYSSLSETHQENYQELVNINAQSDGKSTHQPCNDVTYAELEPSQPIYRTLTDPYSSDIWINKKTF